MEVVSEDGTRIRIKAGQIREVGRTNGLNSSDKTISRRHLSFFIPGESNNEEIHLRFEVLGTNPVYVSKDNEVKIFRRFERGEMGNGDMFCVWAKNPVWYTVRKIENGGEGVRRNDLESELAGDLETGYGFKGVDYFNLDDVDISDVDPVKEFGFVVIGHEFDSYPKRMIKDIKNWDWFLEEEGNGSDDDDDDEGRKGKSQGRGKKRKKGRENDDEEWTGESEDDEVLIEKSRKNQRPKYKTRSKDHGKPSKKGPARTEDREVDDGEDEDEDEDEDDETLGGFIVDDENLEEEEEIDGDGDEEEEEVLSDEDVEEE